MNKRPLLYIAAPYTDPDPVLNTHYVSHVAMEIHEAGKWLPFVPHLNIHMHTVRPRPPRYWYDLDLHYLAHCDALVRLPGYSIGADAEEEYAEQRGIPIIPFSELPHYAQYIWNQRAADLSSRWWK